MSSCCSSKVLQANIKGKVSSFSLFLSLQFGFYAHPQEQAKKSGSSCPARKITHHGDEDQLTRPSAYPDKVGME
jgi:hypothetical protein